MRALPSVLDRLIHWAAPNGTLRRGRVLVVLALAYALFAGTYLPINLWTVGRPAHILYLPGEEAIPFIPAFEFLYVLGYLLPVLAVFVLPSPAALRRLLVAFGLTLAVAYATYLLFPVWLERPTLRPDAVATWLLWLEYHDPSYNHFPSLHVGVSWLLYLACRRGVRFPAILLAMVLAIALSTLFVKQHYMVDVLFGMGLASLAWAVAGKKLTA